MTILSTTGRTGPASRTPRTAVDLLGFDPFRALLGGMQNTGVEIMRTDTGYDIELAVPGFKPGDIDVTVEDGVLTVSGKNEKRTFTRAFSLPDEIDPDAIDGKVEHGLLTLQLRLHPKAQPKRIEIKG